MITMYKEKRPVFEKMNDAVHVGIQNIDGQLRFFHITLQEDSEKYELKIYGLDRKLVGEFDTFNEALEAAYEESDEFFKKRDAKS